MGTLYLRTETGIVILMTREVVLAILIQFSASTLAFMSKQRLTQAY